MTKNECIEELVTDKSNNNELSKPITHNGKDRFRGRKMKSAELIKTLVDGWGKPLVARTETRDFTGGALSDRTTANEESKGNLVQGRFMLGRKIVFPTRNYAEWIARLMLKDA